MPRLSAAYRTAARTAQHHHATAAGIILTFADASTATHDATIYSERATWRPDPASQSGDRQRVYRRKAILPPGIDPIPIGTAAELDGNQYTIEAVAKGHGSGQQILDLIRVAVEQTSRPGGWF